MSAAAAAVAAQLEEAKQLLAELESRQEAAAARARENATAAEEAAGRLAPTREIAELRTAAADSASEAATFARAIQNQERRIETLEAQRERARAEEADVRRRQLRVEGERLARQMYEGLLAHLREHFLPARQALLELRRDLYQAEIRAGRSGLSADAAAASVWDAAPGLGGPLEALLVDLAEDGPRKRLEAERAHVQRMQDESARVERERAEQEQRSREDAERMRLQQAQEEAARSRIALEEVLERDRQPAGPTWITAFDGDPVRSRI